MEINGDQPPLIWPQFESTGYTRRRSSFSTILVPAMIGVISAVIFLLFVTFVAPPFLSITSQIIQPASVKRGWDSINVVLVVFAILCGVLARRNDDGSSSSSSQSSLGVGEEEEEGAVTSGEMNVGEDSKISSSSEQWFDDVYDADRLKIYESVSSRSFSHGLPVTGTAPLRRSSSSYPDLRNGVLRETADRRFRFYDDFEIDKYRSHDARSYEQFSNRPNIEIEESEPKEILIDKFVVRPPSPPPPPQQTPAPSPPPPPPPPRSLPVEVSQKPRRSHRSVRNRDTQENAKRSVINSDSTRFKRAFQPPPSPPPPPPPPPQPLITATPPRKQGSLQRRKSNAAKEIKLVLASLYNQGKRKKKLQLSKRKERVESPVVVMTEPPAYHSSIPPPSPPPPPPPPPPPLRSPQSVFYGLFKKGVKSKKIHSVPAPPPPPRNIQLDPQTPPRRVTSGRPPRPTKPTNLNEESYVNNGQASPLIQKTPPPPPPPPFRVPPLKFVVSGDFAKIRSNQSSRCSSPEREVIDLGWGLELTQSDGRVETSGGTGFCPSLDVNTKADNFIARLRDEWRLDKINSVKGKRKMSSV